MITDLTPPPLARLIQLRVEFGDQCLLVGCHREGEWGEHAERLIERAEAAQWFAGHDPAWVETDEVVALAHLVAEDERSDP